MNAEGLINVSQAVRHGNMRRVKNFKTEKQGVVIRVDGDVLLVNIGASTEIWPYKDCEEITYQ